MNKYITVHSIKALEAKAEISFLVCNIPRANKEKAKELFPDSTKYFIQEHNFKYSIKPVIS